MKFVKIEGLCAAGTWAMLYREAIPADKHFVEMQKTMELMFQGLHNRQNTTVVFGDDTSIVAFIPSAFLAFRVVLEGF